MAPRGRKSPPKTIDEILAVAEDPAYRRVVTARIPIVEQRLRDEHGHLDAQLTTLRGDETVSDPERHQIIQRLAEIEAIFADHVVEFTFRNIGHRAWADLLAKHPPTAAQLRENKRLDHNPTTFPHEAMAATCIKPEGTTPDSFKRLDAAIDTEGWNELWSACVRANVHDLVPNSQAARFLRLSAESARRPITTESHEAASSAE